VLINERYLGEAVVHLELEAFFIYCCFPFRVLHGLPESLGNRRDLGRDGDCEVLCFNRRERVLVIGSEVVEPILRNVIFVEELERVRIFACMRVVTLGRLKAVVLCSLYAVVTLNLGEIARGLLGLLNKWIGRRSIRAGCVGRNRRLQYGRKRRSRKGGLASASEHV
jgi:hypothetical protein